MSYSIISVVPCYKSNELIYPELESLLICMDGEGEVLIFGNRFVVKPFDMLYIPEGIHFCISAGDKGLSLAMAQSFSSDGGEILNISYEERSSDQRYLRKMNRRKVLVMLGEDSKAAKLTAGYVFFEPFARGYPPHKHSDQEEIYHFLEGKGSIEVYSDEKSKTFVHEVKKGDIVTIPLEHYHPVCTQEETLAWAWIIAGERYWIGDRDTKWLDQAQNSDE